MTTEVEKRGGAKVVVVVVDVFPSNKELSKSAK